jgi:hypothetical protein
LASEAKGRGFDPRQPHQRFIAPGPIARPGTCETHHLFLEYMARNCGLLVVSLTEVQAAKPVDGAHGDAIRQVVLRS